MKEDHYHGDEGEPLRNGIVALTNIFVVTDVEAKMKSLSGALFELSDQGEHGFFVVFKNKLRPPSKLGIYVSITRNVVEELNEYWTCKNIAFEIKNGFLKRIC